MCLLLIEGSEPTRESLAAGFRNAGYATEAVGDVDEALTSATRRGHRVIVLDVSIPGMDWLDLLRRMRREKLEDHLHGSCNYPMSNSLASAICLLRRKLEAASPRPLVHTRRGEGYFLGIGA